jgi:hypothetical protein
VSERIDALLGALNDPDFRVRQAAATSLGRVGRGARVVDGLVGMLDRPREAARQAAADALMMVEDGASVPAIIRALEHPDLPVRFAVLSAITGYLLPAEGGPTHGESAGWFKVRKSSDGLTVGAAVGSIVGALIRAAAHSNRRIREAALAALEAVRSSLERSRKRERRAEGDDGWGGAGPDQSGVAETTEELAAVLALEAARLALPEPRYADLELSSGGGRAKGWTPIPHRRPLRCEEPYLLAVAVVVHPSGVPRQDREPQPLPEPGQGSEVTLMVTAEGDGFAVEEPVQPLTLPSRGGSRQSANFRVSPLRATEGGAQRASIRVRLYFRYNLIEELVLRAVVVGKFESAEESPPGAEPPVSVTQNRLVRAYANIDRLDPRVLHIDITRRGGDYLFNFAFFDDEEQKAVFTAPARLHATDLEDELLTVRRTWYDIATGRAFTTRLEGDEEEFLGDLRRLARAGRALWVKLFKRDVNGSMYRVGQWLEKHPLPSGGIIQVSLGHDAADFVFPWSLIYDRTVPDENYRLPDAEGFWGVRYCIEQVLPGPQDADEPAEVAGGVKLDFVQCERFSNIALQHEMLRRLAERSQGRLAVSTPPIDQAEPCYRLLRECDADILYFYTHGYTRHRQADIGVGPNLELFLKHYEHLASDSPLRAARKPLYDEIKSGRFEPDRSWIELTYGRLYLDLLYDRVAGFLSAPVVLLNMCQSAQVTPSLSDSFIHFFLSRGARGVVGTECPMTVEFAHPFAERVLTDILAGASLGEAIRAARIHFLGVRNPLGLAYSLFGSAAARFRPPLFPAPAQGLDRGAGGAGAAP